MKKFAIAITMTITSLSLSACVNDGYGFGGLALGSVMYDGYYDGYYGPIYDGYWGGDGYFYYRQGSQDRQYRRGDHNHFRRPGGMPGGNFRPFQGQSRPDKGVRAPHYPHQGDRQDRRRSNQ